MTTTLPKTDRYGFPVQVCGRCAGTGRHSYNRMHGDLCYGCNGHGVRHTRKAGPQFQAWAYDLKQLRQAMGHTIQVGDELAILEATGVMTTKVVGWHIVTEVVRRDEECGWSITAHRDGTETRTPTDWRMTITFDDGEVSEASTNSVFRRRGWIDPASYVARSM